MDGDDLLTTPEEPAPATAVEDRGGSSSTARTYDCTFCKRGFSNAQALGGHMNIHRKDRAKTKHYPFNQSPPDIPNKLRISPSTSPPPMSYLTRPAHGFDDDVGGSFKWPRIIATQQERMFEDETHEAGAQPRQLRLFAATSSRGGGYHEPSSASSTAAERQEEELDLELRLGPEPPNTTTTLRHK